MQKMIDAMEMAEADRLAQLEYAQDAGLKKGLGKGIRVLVGLGLSDIDIAIKMEIPEDMVKEIKDRYLNPDDEDDDNLDEPENPES
jgi:hypothetical protein